MAVLRIPVWWGKPAHLHTLAGQWCCQSLQHIQQARLDVSSESGQVATWLVFCFVIKNIVL